jgi:hypothetical protein
MRNTLTILLTLSTSFVTFAQAPDTLWTRTYEGIGTFSEWANSVAQTSDGGYIIGGTAYHHNPGILDFCLLKTNSQGDQLWSRYYGNIKNDYGNSVQQTADGGYIIAGIITIPSAEGYHQDFYLVKTDSQGDALWTRTYGGSSNDGANSVQQTADGGYIMAGGTSSFGAGRGDFYLVKTDSLGDTLWTRTYGGSDDDGASSVQQTADGGYIVAGSTSSFGVGGDFYLVKTNSSGYTLWTRTYGGSAGDRANSVQQTADGGYIVAGSTSSFGAAGDFYLVKTDSSGDTLWTRNYGGSSGDGANSVQRTADGGYIMAGYTWSFGAGGCDFYLVKTDSIGDTLWTRTYGGTNYDGANSVQQTTDGGYVVAGHTSSFGAGAPEGNPSMYLVKTGPEFRVSLQSPNGGEEWRILQYDTVRWIGSFEGGVKLELNRDYPSGAWEVLVDSTENDGEEPVWVTDPLSNHCRVKMSALEYALFDVSDGDFSIVSSQGYLALVRPSQPTAPVLLWYAETIECNQDSSETFRLKNFGSEVVGVFQPLEPTSGEFSRTTACSSYFTLAPGEMSTCDMTLTFAPAGAQGLYRDTLLVASDAVNAEGGYVRFPLSGEQITTLAAPQVVIATEGIDARLLWNPVTQSIAGCLVSAVYLVFYCPTMGESYYFHGYTTDTTYVHAGVVQFAGGMFYEVVAYVGPLELLEGIPPDATREEVFGRLSH